MGNLSLFLNQLRQHEIDSLDDLKFKGKRAQLIDYLLDNPYPNLEVLTEDLDISLIHYYKLCSVILHKAYEHFAPSHPQRLIFLAQKSLSKHLEMEFSRLSRDLKCGEEQHSRLLQTAFRAFGFEVFRGAFFEKQKEIALQLNTCAEREDLNSILSCILKRQALRWEFEIPAENYPEFDSVAYKFYRFRLDSDLEIQKGNHQKALELTKAALSLDVNLEEFIPEWEIQQVYFELAEIYDLMERHEQAYQIFHHRFSVYPRLEEFFPEYHNLYLNHLLMRKEFDLVHERLSGCCPQVGQFDVRVGCFRYYLMYAFMFLMQDRVRSSYSFVRRYQSQSQKFGDEFDEIEARKLETLYFAFSEDKRLLDSLIKKNLKFLQRKGHKAGESSDLDFFRLVQALVVNYGKVPNRRNLQNRLDFLQKGSNGIWGRMLLELAKRLQTASV